MFASLSDSRPCFWREIWFVQLRGPLHLRIPPLIEQRSREQLLVYKWQSHLIREPRPRVQKHEWAVWLIHPTATANQHSALPPWPSLKVIPSQLHSGLRTNTCIFVSWTCGLSFLSGKTSLGLEIQGLHSSLARRMFFFFRVQQLNPLLIKELI